MNQHYINSSNYWRDTLAGRFDNDRLGLMFRADGTDVYLRAEGDARMLRLEQVGDGIRLSLATDYIVPAALGEDDQFGVASLRALLMDSFRDPLLARVRYAADAGADPTAVRWIEFEFSGGLRLTAGPISPHGIALTVGPSFDEWDDGIELPALADLVGARLRDVVVPGFVERDQKDPELRVFPTIVYFVLDQGLVQAEQVRGGGGVQFRAVSGMTAPVELIDDDDEVAYLSLAPVLLGDSSVTGARYATGREADPGQGIVRAAEFQLGDALRLVLDPMTLLGLELGVRRPEPPGEPETIEVTRAHRP